ncbi:MAG: histidine ammonia-lyase [Candidatus Bipolaricaulota bacterium]|nr:histidine ammonia-lyase [Candidatus Bipolaricaulota bacterium]
MIELDGHLTPQDAEAIVLRGAPVALAPSARAKVEASHRALQALLARGEPVYGVNTGFGALSTVRIPDGELGKLQRNIVLSHAAGVGTPLPDEAVRGMLLFRLNSFLQGASGVRPAVVDLLLGMLNAGVHPLVPEQGSVGSSGDLVPLAHLALPLLGEGRARVRGEELPGGEALRRAGLAPLSELAPKEGLALLNGTAYMLALLFLAWTYGWRALRGSLGIAALSFQALRGRTEALDGRIHALRPHPGQAQVASWLRELLTGSALANSHRGDVQDPYSLRCLPQILGPVVEALWAVEGRLRVEMNAATDNPLILPDGGGTALAGGNFHGEILAFAGEWLAVALAELGAASERRLGLLLTGEARGLPPFLAPQPGTNSGLMLLQYTAAALAAENKVLAHPAATDSIPTSAGKEDHNSMGATSAWKALRIAENALSQVALEGVAARWAVALAGEEDLAPASRPIYEALAALVPPPGEDGYLGDAIANVRAALREGRISPHGL